MPRKGYKSITLSDETVSSIDELIDEKSKTLSTRPGVISHAISTIKRGVDHGQQFPQQ